LRHALMHEAGHPFHEKIALDLLESDGIATIWLLHLIAARAYRDGHSQLRRDLDRDSRRRRAG
jgi:hypothetical protein